MRYGIFSDVHANLDALEAVLRAFEREKIDALVCLGDTVGYGSQPNDCCDIVKRVTRYTILGNHDAAVAGRMDYSYYYDAAREALDWHSRQLTSENMNWLRKLNYFERDGATHPRRERRAGVAGHERLSVRLRGCRGRIAGAGDEGDAREQPARRALHSRRLS
ncbi:metallophosphoesterase family protein [Nannocystis sp. RBIL2]|uniref:metallophosphoesterase family protein n=1 Tax=Nannocystis sp. RBIL2 TaxID=2996788 RepID=UPI00226EC63F|nr:metallophosphoesterase family protein [Nannocystis sp. RBIL2]MCY1063485.1 metallophosphoesterase family protein [Nannocystis sp. RBIL2]